MAKLVIGTSKSNAVPAVVKRTTPEYYLEFQLDSNNKLVRANPTQVMSLTNATDVGEAFVLTYAYYQNPGVSGLVDFSGITTLSKENCFAYTFNGCANITGVDLSNLTAVTANSCCAGMFASSGITSFDLSELTEVTQLFGCYYMFNGCNSLTAASLPKLTTVSGSQACAGMFAACVNLASASLPRLTTVSGANGCNNMFNGCTNLANITLPSLAIITGGCTNMVTSCTSLVTVSFPSLTNVDATGACSQMFSFCKNLENVYFPSLTPTSFGSYVNQFNNLLQVTGTSKTHTIHFPSNVESTIQGLTGYPLFGGSSGYITLAFDLPATNTLTGADTNVYTRNPKYDTGTALAWKVGAYGTTNFDPAYYTSGLTNPTVGTTIYSDSACTTSVTTVSSIA